MRVVGLDLGERRIGVAVSDSAGRLAVAHATVERSGDGDADRRKLVDIVRELEAERVVVGLPLSLDGSHGPAAQRAEGEAVALREALGLPVELADERFTTATATRSLVEAGVGNKARRRVVDQIAATVLLQSWLDGHRAGSGAPRGSGMEHS